MGFKGICVVDDNEEKRHDILRVMCGLSLTNNVHSFCCVHELLGFMQKRVEPSEAGDWLIMLDMQMPMMLNSPVLLDGGFETMEELRRMNRVSPVIVVSSEGIDEERARMYAGYLGAVRYHFRNTRQLSDDVREILGQHAFLPPKDAD